MLSQENIVTMRAISKTYFGVHALDNVDFELKQGEIHCLLGENGSGKSTLIKILCGVETPNPGADITIAGQQYKRLTRSASLEEGVSVIYQDLSLFPNLSVAENICFNYHIDKKHALVKRSMMRKKAMEVIEMMGQKLDPDVLVETLSVADRQLVAICKALVGKLKVLVMDEPTSSLTAKEVKNMFFVVRKLVEMGTTILFISHKLEEVVEIADRITILKDGKIVGQLEKKDITKANIVRLMSGKDLKLRKLDQPLKSDKSILEVKDLCLKGKFKNINFCVREGEVVGITGLLGSGRTELALAIVGYAPADSGKVLVEGIEVRLRNICDGICAGMALVSEDRLNEGLIMRQSVEFNLAITTLPKQVNRIGMLDKQKKLNIVEEQISDIGIKVPSLQSHVGTLSGGNQQKVVVGKWLATHPKILILDGPTIGIDIAARSGIYEIIKKLAADGMAVIIISDEVQEVLENSHRIFVMHNGELVQEFDASITSEQEIVACVGKDREAVS